MEKAVNAMNVEETDIGLNSFRVTAAPPFKVDAEDILSQVTFTSAQVEEIVSYFLKAPGKRLRPALLHMSAAVVRRPAHHLKEAAALIEILHNGTLIHDDVIDRAQVRRGRPSVNRLWGDSVGILIGDYLLAYVMELTNRISVPRISQWTSSILISLVEGQLMELANQNNFNLERETCFEIIRKKTAALIKGACQMGGLLANGTPREVQALGQFGENLGMAFQILDDCLDYCGNAEFFGKEIGKDVLEGKITLPLILAYEKATPKDRGKIRAVFQLQGKEGGFLSAQSLIEKYNGLKNARQEARARTQKAVEALCVFTGGTVRDEMIRLAENLLQRKC